MSLLCFDHDIPLPAIAAGMDFMNSKFMGEALRRCGAFFIRRQFGNVSDQVFNSPSLDAVSSLTGVYGKFCFTASLTSKFNNFYSHIEQKG